MEPLLILDAQGTILEANQVALSSLPIDINKDFVSFIQEKESFHRILNETNHTLKVVSLDPLTFHIPHSDPIQARCQLTAYKETEDGECRFLTCINLKTAALESLEVTARLNDQRVEKLRNNLTTVTQELLEKTLQLAEQKNKVSTIIDGMGEGLIGCDDKGIVIHVNHAAQRLIPASQDITLGASFTQCYPDLAKAIHYQTETLATLEKQTVDLAINKKDLRVSVSPIFDEEKQRHAGFVLILHDRTEQAELDRMKADLISIVSHELRSPLTSIKGYVDLMTSGDLGTFPDSMKEYLDIISANANRLAALIDDMLDLSKIETGKLNMSFGKVDIKYLCDYVYLTMKPQAEQKKHSFSVDIEEGLSISGDVDRLQQALTNLVSNSIKYTPDEGKITIGAKRNNGWVVIYVQDNGLGISEENQKRLFQKFFRIKNEKTRNIGGTGLGLCITKSIIEAHDGRIIVNSTEGKGSTFSLELPVYHS